MRACPCGKTIRYASPCAASVPASIEGTATSQAMRRLIGATLLAAQAPEEALLLLVLGLRLRRGWSGRRRLGRDRARDVVPLALGADRGVHVVFLRLLAHFRILLRHVLRQRFFAS